MKFKKIPIPIFILFFISTSAQEDYEYMGVIQLNDSSFISYRIAFEEVDGLIKGTSVTDMGGPHETRSFITGSFDAENDAIEFYESDILYTKSYISRNDFCYVHFTGKLKNLNDRQGIQGSFDGLYDDGESCINGTINLLNFKKILRRAKRLDKKIDRTILISKKKRDKINLVRDLDSLNLNVIKKDEVLNVFSGSSEVVLRLFDAGQEDGDRVSLHINDSLLLDNYTVTNKPKEIRVTIEEPQTTLLIQALNAGTVGGNTVKLELVLDESTVVDALTNLKEGEKAILVLRKR
jgi:hypothetical protein